MVTVIGIFSGKGGVGKTTVASNLASVLSLRFGKKVTLIDLNVTAAHLAAHFGLINPENTLNDVLSGKKKLNEVITVHDTGVQLIPSAVSLSKVTRLDAKRLAYRIRKYLKDEDFVIIDTAPGFGREAIIAMNIVDKAIIVTTPDVTSVMDAIKGKEFMEKLGIEVIGIVMNMVTKKPYEISKKDVERLSSVQVIAEIPFDFKFRESLVKGIPLVVKEKKWKLNEPFIRMAEFLTGEEIKRSRRFGRLFSLLRNLPLNFMRR